MNYKELLEQAINDNEYRLFVTGKGDHVEMKFLIPADYYEQIIRAVKAGKEHSKHEYT